MSNKITLELKSLLSEVSALYLKTLNYHWNVEGPNFFSLHKMFEDQYNDLSEAIDTLAELIRGLGKKVPSSFAHANSSSIIKAGNENANSSEMLKDLIEDNVKIQSLLSKSLKIAEESEDEVVIGYIIERMTTHRKSTWIMKSCLKNA